jgi:hypothetical protein
MMNRQRRKRINLEEEDESSRRDSSTELQERDREPRVIFMEEVNYKMEISEPQEEVKRVPVKKEEFTEEERN